MKRAAYLVGVIVLAAVLAVVLLGPAYIDRPAVQAGIQQRLSQALQGQVAWEALEVAFLPVPHGELRKLRVEVPGKLTASADDVNVYLRLWPLFRGAVEISSLTLKKPTIRVATSGGDGTASESPFDAVAAYRTAMGPATHLLQEFAPDTAFKLEEATVEVGADITLRDLRAEARTDGKGVALELSSAASLWKRLLVEAHVDYADLAARATVAVEALTLDQEIPPATLRVKLRTDAKSAIEADFDGSVGAVVPAAKGRLLAPAGKPPQLVAELSDVDLAKTLAIARRKVPGLDAVESAEGRVSAKIEAALERAWRLRLDIVQSSAAVKLTELPWNLSAHGAKVALTGERLHVTELKGSLGNSTFSNAALQVELAQPARLSSASARATLDLAQLFPWLQTKLPLDEVSSVSGSADVTLSRLALRFDKPAAADYDVAVTPRGVSVVLKALPAAVTADGGSVRVGPKAATLENVAVAMLDARTRVSGTAGIAKPAVELALAEGVAGEKIVQWALQRGELPARFEPKTPLRFVAKRVAWAPQGALEADARVDFDGGPQVAFAFASKPKLMELQRIAIKDGASDALIGLTLTGDVIRANFSGTLQGRSVAAMLRRPGPETASGSAQGKFQVTIDRAQPRRTLGEGRLRVDALDLSWLAGRTAIVEQLDLTAEPDRARLVAARLNLEEQHFDLQGTVQRTEQGPVIDARLESPGVDLERLLPEPQPKEEKKEQSNVWPLPITGRIEMRSGFVQYKDYKVAPFGGRLTLERERALLEVQQARMCGVSFPMELEAVPEKVTLAAHISMRDEPFERAAQCLTKDAVQITGNADFTAELRTEGRRPNLARNLTGTVQAEMRKGEVKKFALIGNILSFRNIASVGKMEQSGFPYRSMTAKGHFKDGDFQLEEGFFDSDAVRLAAHGRIALQAAESQLTVLVGLLTTVDRVAGAIPLVGYVFGGSMTALPVSVTGDIRNPLVVPLGPRAISDRLLGIFERTLKLPGKLTVPAADTKPPEK